MGLFDIFKKETDENSGEGMPLEELLQKAAAEPAFRAQFYKRLLTDELVVITQGSPLAEGSHTLKESTSVKIVSFQDGRIPVFTSTERIFDQGIIKQQVEYVGMKGEDLFRLAKGATFLLNPYSPFGKELLPDEVERLLSGTILPDASRTLTMQKDTRVQIGQPSRYPTEIVNSLKKLFIERPEVKAAYLGWIFNPESGEPPHYIFALDAEGDLQNLIREAGFAANHYLNGQEFVDFMQIDRNGGISDYFLKQTEPFYLRQ